LKGEGRGGTLAARRREAAGKVPVRKDARKGGRTEGRKAKKGGTETL
jgi:hypothetical protein